VSRSRAADRLLRTSPDMCRRKCVERSWEHLTAETATCTLHRKSTSREACRCTHAGNGDSGRAFDSSAMRAACYRHRPS